MKDGVHPTYEACVITCTCGAKYHTRSTKSSIHVEICASCHPFFTGQQRMVDTAGRVEKFRKKYTKPAGKK
jgi:large subunit ribosomal protein L31